MLKTYNLNGEIVDSLDLKVLLISNGIDMTSNVIFENFGATHRISQADDLMACDCVLLPDRTVVHLTNVGSQSPFSMDISENGKPCILYNGQFVTEVDLPPKTSFYEQFTSSGIPFKWMAVLQGLDVLAFPYLWPCEYARAGFACQYCHTGGFTEQLAKEGHPDQPFPTAQDVAEIVNYAIHTEELASHIQITGGSTMNPQAECHLIASMLNTIDDVAGLENIRGEMLIYTTPPSDPSMIDDVFDAGADRVACSLEVWDENLVAQVCPGKTRFTGRDRHLRTLLHIADKYGPNKACSSFVVGVEPVESFLAGAEYLASNGIVPIASVWIPHGRPVLGKTETPGIDYYRQLRNGLAEIYTKYNCEPPGTFGFNVCLCRDTWNHRDEIVTSQDYRMDCC